MMKIKKIALAFVAAAMLTGASAIQAAIVNIEITGTIDAVFAGDTFGVNVGDEVIASGVFDDIDLAGDGSGVIDFSVAGNDLNINVNGSIFTDSMDIYGGGLLTLNSGHQLFDFQYGSIDGDFGSFFNDFMSDGQFTGIWDTNVTISAVPVPAAAWLFGSGLIALVGFVLRNK